MTLDRELAMFDGLPTDLLARAVCRNEVEIAWRFPDVPEAARSLATIGLLVVGGEVLIIYPPDFHGGGVAALSGWETTGWNHTAETWDVACARAADETVEAVTDLHRELNQSRPLDELGWIWYDFVVRDLNPNYRLGWAKQ
jgi:hypothetical protein